LNGLEAISEYNGWAMAMTGPLIVMSGLAILAIIISQLHKVVALFDKKPEQKTAPLKQETKKKAETGTKQTNDAAVPKRLPDDIFETARIYQKLVDTLEQPFKLNDLYKAAEKSNFPHPILTVNRFRDAGILKTEKEGLFIWDV
jgi:Na+-transporting methylmalonyl-CoA/oxaloacetate decarboxylase gamma subunit